MQPPLSQCKLVQAQHRPVVVGYQTYASAHTRWSRGPKHLRAVGEVPAQDRAVEQRFHTLADGAKMEVLFTAAQNDKEDPKPPMVFMHGTFHGAWCFAEKFMPHFAGKGYSCYSLSFRGHGESEVGEFQSTLREQVEDVKHFLATVPGKPILICHSFSGLIVHQYLAEYNDEAIPKLSAVAFLAAVPAEGTSDAVSYWLKEDPLWSLQITWVFITKGHTRSRKLLKKAFFSEDLPDEDLDRYEAAFKRFTPKCGLVAISKVKKDLPIPPPKDPLPPAYVQGYQGDRVSAPSCVTSIARRYEVEPVVLKNMAHDSMLDTNWKDSADSISQWLQEIKL